MKPPLGYATSALLRHSAERDPRALAQAHENPRTGFIVIAEDIPILRAGAGAPGTSILSREDMARFPEQREEVLLGTLDGRPVVAVLVDAQVCARLEADPLFKAADLRSIAMQGLVPADELGALATAKSLLDWHRRHRFCAQCGAPTAPAQAGFRRDCAACGAQHFPRTDPVVIMMVTRGDQCLLGRQARFPAGSYSCLAGFLEPGETIEDAVRRETFEEAGIRVGAVTYALSQPWPFPSSIMIGCRGEALTDTITLDREELEDARWFRRDEVRLMLRKEHPGGLIVPPPVAIAHHLVRDWAEGA